MTTVTAVTAVPVTAVPQTTPAWWIHWLNEAVAAASFVGVVIHPGWHPPPELVLIVAPLALVLAVVSGVVFAVLHHATGKANLTVAADYLKANASQLVAAAGDLAPLVARYPAVETRLAALESGSTVAVLPANLTRLLDAMSPPKAPAPTTTANGPPAPAGAF